VTATWVDISAPGTRAVVERVVQSVQAATEAAPTAASDGISLLGAGGFTLRVECDSGQSFAAAAGQFDIYHYDPQVGLPWAKLVDREQSIPPSAIGSARFTWLFEVVSARGRVAFIANGLSLTGGGVTLTFAPAAGPQPGRLD
jgi:hypothetical protein